MTWVASRSPTSASPTRSTTTGDPTPTSSGSALAGRRPGPATGAEGIIRDAKTQARADGADIVVAACTGAREYVAEPTPDQSELAKALLDPRGRLDSPRRTSTGFSPAR